MCEYLYSVEMNLCYHIFPHYLKISERHIHIDTLLCRELAENNLDHDYLNNSLLDFLLYVGISKVPAIIDTCTSHIYNCILQDICWCDIRQADNIKCNLQLYQLYNFGKKLKPSLKYTWRLRE